MKADPKKSEGARMERAAFRAYLRRLLKSPGTDYIEVQPILDWVLARQSRYDKTKGGLGKK